MTRPMTIKWPDGIPATEYSREFDQGRADRMAVSYCKYGPLADAYPHRVDAIQSLEQRLQLYRATGNTEWLMDVANFAMIEFMHPRHERAHFKATDSSDSPGRAWVNGTIHQGRNDNRDGARCYRHDGD